jgi:hypothetical protein
MNHGTFEKGEKFEAGKMVEVQEGAIVSRTLIDYPTGTVTLLHCYWFYQKECL